MSEYGEYLVTGKRAYRGHEPGTVFEAQLDKLPEARAIQRGDIRVLRRFTPSVEPGSYRLPDDWPPQATSVSPAKGAPDRGSSHVKGG